MNLDCPCGFCNLGFRKCSISIPATPAINKPVPSWMPNLNAGVKAITVNAHRPELTLMSHDGGEWKRWQVEVHETRLKLSGISESSQNTIMMFSRISEFPE